VQKNILRLTLVDFARPTLVGLLKDYQQRPDLSRYWRSSKKNIAPKNKNKCQMCQRGTHILVKIAKI
jgi:hypothetical protein